MAALSPVQGTPALRGAEAPSQGGGVLLAEASGHILFFGAGHQPPARLLQLPDLSGQVRFVPALINLYAACSVLRACVAFCF